MMQDGKGRKGENCNRTACQAPASAHYYNKATRAWYCESCAQRIEASAVHWGKGDTNILFDDLNITKTNCWRYRP